MRKQKHYYDAQKRADEKIHKKLTFIRTKVSAFLASKDVFNLDIDDKGALEVIEAKLNFIIGNYHHMR